MNPTDFAAHLTRLGIDPILVNQVRYYKWSSEDWWATTERGDWMGDILVRTLGSGYEITDEKLLDALTDCQLDFINYHAYQPMRARYAVIFADHYPDMPEQP